MTEKLIEIPSLDRLPHIIHVLEQAVRSVPLAELPRLMGDVECIARIAELRLKTGTQPANSQPIEERYLAVEEVAERFHVTPRWLYRHKKHMPHSQPSRKLLLFPEKGIAKWFEARTNRG